MTCNPYTWSPPSPVVIMLSAWAPLPQSLPTRASLPFILGLHRLYSVLLWGCLLLLLWDHKAKACKQWKKCFIQTLLSSCRLPWIPLPHPLFFSPRTTYAQLPLIPTNTTSLPPLPQSFSAQWLIPRVYYSQCTRYFRINVILPAATNLAIMERMATEHPLMHLFCLFYDSIDYDNQSVSRTKTSPRTIHKCQRLGFLQLPQIHESCLMNKGSEHVVFAIIHRSHLIHGIIISTLRTRKLISVLQKDSSVSYTKSSPSHVIWWINKSKFYFRNEPFNNQIYCFCRRTDGASLFSVSVVYLPIHSSTIHTC